MKSAGGVRIAIDLLQLPSRARWYQSAPLPDDVLSILQIAAGDGATIDEAVAATGHSPETVTRAAEFFVEQIVLSAQSDSYRLLAATPKASAGELRRNMALLMRWLHPDQHPSQKQALYAVRVTKAWEDLKSTERRANYDRVSVANPAIPATPHAIAVLTKPRLKKRLADARSKPFSVSTSTALHAKLQRPKTIGFFRKALRRLTDRLRPSD